MNQCVQVMDAIGLRSNLPDSKIFLWANDDGDGSGRCSFDDDPAMFRLFNALASYGAGSL